MATAERHELESEGQRLVAWSWGGGPTVLLMHGWEGRGSQMAAFAAPLAAAGFRSVSVDAPGHGASPGTSSSLSQFADAVLAVADRFGPLHGVVAHSFGASAAGWAKHRGLPVSRLVFVAAAYDMTEYVAYFADLLGITRRSREIMVRLLEESTGIRWAQAAFSTTDEVLETVSPLVRRIVARNPGSFTGPGTGTYVVGHGRVAVIDPGPAITSHTDAILRSLGEETVDAILITHSHVDHWPGMAAIQQATGARTYGFGPKAGKSGGGGPESSYHGFITDTAIGEGETLVGPGWHLKALHTPGHASDHL